MHLAAALKKTGVAIFGSTDPVATGPNRWSMDRFAKGTRMFSLLTANL